VVSGLEETPDQNRPPVNVVRLAFQSMVGIGSLLALLSVVFLFVRMRRGRLPKSTWFYRALVAAGPLSWPRSDRVTTRSRPPAVDRLRPHAAEAVSPAPGLFLGFYAVAIYAVLTVFAVYVLLVAGGYDVPAPYEGGGQGAPDDEKAGVR
jgi:cytochrome d ubiquinol oxidase subunit I